MDVLKKGKYIGRVGNAIQSNGIIAGVTTYTNDETNGGMHSHENPHISFILKGGSIDKRVRTAAEQYAGSIAFYYAGEPHQTVQKIFPAQHINIELDFKFLDQYHLCEGSIDKCVNEIPDPKFFMIKIYYEFLINDKHSKPAIDMLLLALLNNVNCKAKHQPSWIKSLKEVLHEQWNETLELNYLSQLLSIHPVTISKNFSRYFGCSFGEYMRKLKIEKSISLIKSGNRSLTEIAYECGFADQSHFIRTFKNYTGILPFHFKKV